MAVKTNREITSFKLLEEEPSDMKPTAAMKKFVGMVLDKKDMKDKDVTCSFRNLTEYRNPVSSPPVCVSNGLFEPHGLDGDSDSPVSPGPVQMDDDRLPNELLDEICEDIGMKEGMELDFVEYLMEQDDMDPYAYMTPEALTSGAYNASSFVNKMGNHPPGPGSDSGSIPGCKPLEPVTPSKSIPVSIPNTSSAVTSSASSSPASKRFHMSTSEQSSPAKSISSQSSAVNSQVFKMPQTPPTPKRPMSASQGLPSPSQPSGTHSTTSVSHSQGGIATKRCYSPSPLTSCSQQQIASKKAQAPPQSPTSKQSGTLHYGQSCQITSPRPACPAPQKQVNNQQGFQRLGKPAPPVVNVQTYQQQRWMQQQQQQQQNLQGYNNDSSLQYSKIDSPLDHGYYSSDSVSRSQPTSTPSGYAMSSLTDQQSMYNMKRSDSSSNLSTMSVGSQSSQSCRQHAGSSHQQPKSVHFAEGASEPSPDCQDPSQMQNYAQGFDASSECGFDLEQEFRDNSQKPMQSKMLPRLSSVKPEIAPYTVPNPGQQPLPYDHQRSSCSVSQGGNGSSRAGSMQTFDYSGKNPDSMYYMDNNQNMMRIETGEYPTGNYQGGYNNGGMTDQMKAVMAGLPDNDMYKNQPADLTPSTPQGYNNTCSMPGMNQGANSMMPNQMGQNYSQGANYPNSCANSQMMNANSNSMPGQYQNMSSQQQFDQTPYCQTRGQTTMATPIYPNNGTQGNMGQGNQWMGTPQTPQNMQQMQQMQMAKTPMGVQQMGGMPGPGGQPMPHGAQAIQPGMTPGGVPHMQPCTIPNCSSCKTGSPHRPPMLASQQSFIQHLITDRSNAFRSHPLFPLLRDLIIADMNFSSPNFPYQLISNLPADFDKLLQNFLQRNPPTGNYQGNYAVESVIMDALRYAHQCIIEKIRMRQDQDKHTKTTSKSLSAIEEFCEKFDRAVRNTVPGQPSPNDPGNPMMLPPGGDMSSMMGGPPGGVMSGVPQMGKDPKYMMDPTMSHPAYVQSGMGKVLGMGGMGPPQYEMMKSMSDNVSTYSNSSGLVNKAESKKHPSLPKEAVAMMLDWLRNHKDNPYPNDDEKAMLIKQTGLTINQINYWFTNARRRILPKWAQCK